MRACKCPNCGANLKVSDDDREFMFCEFCGARIDLTDHRTVHTEHIVDDAKIKNAESIHRIVDIFASPFENYRRKKQEKEAQEAREAEEAAEAARIQEEKNREQAEAFKAASTSAFAWCAKFVKHHKEESIAGLVAVALLISLASGASRNDARKKAAQAEAAASSHMAMGELRFLDDTSFTGDYRNTYKELKDAGFTNITLSPAEDLIFGFLETENDIIEVTVDGAPSFDEDAWYPADVPIVISYHSFISSASSKVEEVKDAVAQKAQDTVDSAMSKVQEVITQETQSITSSASESASSSSEDMEDFVTTKSVIKSFSYEYVFLHNGASNSHHYWLLDIKNGVACQINTYVSSACLLTLPSDDFNAGVLLDYGTTSFDLHSNNFSSGLSVKYGDDGAYFFSTSTVKAAFSDLDSVQTFYDFRSLSTTPSIATSGVHSEGKTPASSSSSTSSEPSKPEPSLNYTPSHQNTNYDAAYALKTSDYTNYCLISYTDKIVRYFTYGNDSKSAYVGHITGGSKTKGLTVHFNYDGGWDETIRIDSIYMILTDSSGNTFTFTVAPLSPVRDIYKNANYRDIQEN